MKKECNKCHEEKKLSEFSKNRTVNDGYQRACKSCMEIANKKSRAKKPKHYSKKQAIRVKKNRIDFEEYKRNRGCEAMCGESEPACLDLHHHEDNKEHNVSNLTTYSLKKMITEADKCIVLCANCHRKLHAGVINLQVLK